ncbi:helix-turn-helix domain-containing protein [Clavibacter michiganensis]|uniref:helix-turn-helix domain-containing protein n=1 Tax=Clavibacter michiganensis TaxID=28447 RepID=UPI000E6AC8EC|nr:helix-turn-helix transcriptional regulator [Clavibacter michiganensis]
MNDDQELSQETMTIASNLRKARKSMGLTQEQLSERTGIPVATLKKYEGGKQPPPGDRIGALARALAVSADDIVLEESERRVSDELRAIFQRFDQLPDEMKKQVKIAVRGILISYEQELLEQR